MVAIIATVRVKASLKMLGVVKAIYMGSRPRWRGLASTGKAPQSGRGGGNVAKKTSPVITTMVVSVLVEGLGR